MAIIVNIMIFAYIPELRFLIKYRSWVAGQALYECEKLFLDYKVLIMCLPGAWQEMHKYFLSLPHKIIITTQIKYESYV